MSTNKNSKNSKNSKNTAPVAPVVAKAGRGRPQKPMTLPDSDTFTITDVQNVNPNIRCRLSIYTKVGTMVKNKELFKTGTMPTGGVGKPMTVYTKASALPTETKVPKAKKAKTVKAKAKKAKAKAIKVSDVPAVVLDSPVETTEVTVPAEVGPAELVTA